MTTKTTRLPPALVGTAAVSSPVKWIGGKGRLAARIVAHFPPPSSYAVYAEPFCGAAHVLFARPTGLGGHLEAINDRNEGLVNFWLVCRDEAERLVWKLDTLPYAQSLFARYRALLAGEREETRGAGGEVEDRVERAARWLYLNRSIFGARINASAGWGFHGAHEKVAHNVGGKALGYHNAVATLRRLTGRLARVQIHAQDFEPFCALYESEATLFYVDPPYLGTPTSYYEVDGTPPFTEGDHRRLARLLCESRAKVALSHYEHPLLEELYPAPQWRRVTFAVHKESSHLTGGTSVPTREMLLMNYDPHREVQIALWSGGGQEEEEEEARNDDEDEEDDAGERGEERP